MDKSLVATTLSLSLSLSLALALALVCPRDARADPPVSLDVKRFRIVERESGKTNYYSIVDSADGPFIRAQYKPGYDTAVLGYQVADADRSRARVLRWKWRAQTLPSGGNECVDGKSDSAAVVYATWKRGLRWYNLKYVWSASAPKGAVCERKRNPLVAQDTIVLESGGPTNVWRSETVDLQREYRKHFEDGDANATVPDFVGVGVMSDGDQTKSESAADYGGFVLER